MKILNLWRDTIGAFCKGWRRLLPARKLGPAVRDILPEFRQIGVDLDLLEFQDRPHSDFIHPSVLDVGALEKQALARYYMYYAPHDAPGGIYLAFSENLEGPWREYDRGPVISREWLPHYQVSHVSSPHALWNTEEKRMFLFFHGENDTTRYAVSSDGINFEYGGIAVDASMFGPDLTEASYARVFRHPVAAGKGPYVMMLMGNHKGTRNVYRAWSRDGRRWEADPDPFLTPPPGTNQMGPGWLFEWQECFYVVAFANRAESPTYDPVSDLHLYKVSPNLDQIAYQGLLMAHTAMGLENRRISDPCLFQTQHRLYLFISIGRRLNQRLALLVADLPAPPPASGDASDDGK